MKTVEGRETSAFERLKGVRRSPVCATWRPGLLGECTGARRRENDVGRRAGPHERPLASEESPRRGGRCIHRGRDDPVSCSQKSCVAPSISNAGQLETPSMSRCGSGRLMGGGPNRRPRDNRRTRPEYAPEFWSSILPLPQPKGLGPGALAGISPDPDPPLFKETRSRAGCARRREAASLPECPPAHSVRRPRIRCPRGPDTPRRARCALASRSRGWPPAPGR